MQNGLHHARPKFLPARDPPLVGSGHHLHPAKGAFMQPSSRLTRTGRRSAPALREKTLLLPSENFGEDCASGPTVVLVRDQAPRQGHYPCHTPPGLSAASGGQLTAPSCQINKYLGKTHTTQERPLTGRVEGKNIELTAVLGPCPQPNGWLGRLLWWTECKMRN